MTATGPQEGGFAGRIPEENGSPATGAVRVERTGIALVHEGECIVPEQGCEALVAADGGGGVVVNYYFPVEVEVVGELSDEQVRRVTDHVFDELSRELGSRV